MSEIKEKTDWEKDAKVLAEAHVSWYLESIRPLLIDHMIHGFKHGREYVFQEKEGRKT